MKMVLASERERERERERMVGVLLEGIKETEFTDLLLFTLISMMNHVLRDLCFKVECLIE